MSYLFSVSGHVDSAKGEAEVLAKAVAFAEDAGAEGSFSFNGGKFQVHAGPPADATAKAREQLVAYNATADADDRVEIPATP